MKRIVLLLFGGGLCLFFCSCDFFVWVTFENQTSTPVIISSSEKFKHEGYNSLVYDTVAPDSESLWRYVSFRRQSLVKRVKFFKFETPTQSVCFEGPKEVRKVINKEGRFIITDSLFSYKDN